MHWKGTMFIAKVNSYLKQNLDFAVSSANKLIALWDWMKYIMLLTRTLFTENRSELITWKQSQTKLTVLIWVNKLDDWLQT